ncbi:MAG: Omp28-related outer membrane protein, partial [Calditrichia bacterium]
MVLNNLAHQYGDQVAVVSVYSSSGSPPFYNPAANQKIHQYPPPYWYNHSWYFATPWLWVDGSKHPAYLTNTWQTYINNRLQVVSDLDIQLFGNYNPQTNILDLQMSISNTGMDTIRGRLHSALTENGILWHAPNGQQVHNHVPRIWWPDADGLPVSIPPGDTEIQFANWNIGSTWNADSLWIMAFVQDNVMQPDTTIEIFQGAVLKMSDIVTSIERNRNNITAGFQLYQNY